MTWITTFTGRKFSYVDLDPASVHLEDIVVSLARLPRFLGHTPTPLTVAEHCCRVAREVPAEYRLEALLHDASEAYLGDIPKPLKDMIPTYKTIEDQVSRLIAEVFGAVYPWPAEVKEADLRMLETEHRDLLYRSPPWDRYFGVPYRQRVKCWSRRKSRRIFERELHREIGLRQRQSTPAA